MNDSVRDLVSALLAMGYAAVLLVLGELYIDHRSKLPTILVKSQSYRSMPAALRSPLALVP
jgi:hypothetical protein